MGTPKDIICLQFDKFSDFIVQNHRKVTPQNFSKRYTSLQNNFLESHAGDLFCSKSAELAEALTKQEQNDFAGIIYSALCEITELIPHKLEIFAKRGYETAKSNGDYVHMMARLNNLRKLYIDHPNLFQKYIKVLHKQEECLQELTTHYAECADRHKSIKRPIGSKEQYEQMLAYVQTEIAKLTKEKHPEECLERLRSAREVFNRQHNTRSVSYIEMLISETEKIINSKRKNNINIS